MIISLLLIMKRKAEFVYKVRIVAANREEYFTSVSAIYVTLDVSDLGVSLRRLWEQTTLVAYTNGITNKGQSNLTVPYLCFVLVICIRNWCLLRESFRSHLQTNYRSTLSRSGRYRCGYIARWG